MRLYLDGFYPKASFYSMNTRIVKTGGLGDNIDYNRVRQMNRSIHIGRPPYFPKTAVFTGI